jgi:GT2 family glycosyltransferase
MNLALRRDIIRTIGGFDETLVRGEDTDLTYRITRQYKLIYEPKAVIWFKGSPDVWTASRKCVRHFIGVGQLIAKHGLNRKFFRFNLVARGLILIVALASIFLLPWQIPITLITSLLMEFIYKTVEMYRKYHDHCVVYYALFFTFWSLASLAIFYGLCIGFRYKLSPRKTHI